jgi:hypothetical protein
MCNCPHEEPSSDWFGMVLEFLEYRIKDAPDETCRALARNLWEDADALLCERHPLPRIEWDTPNSGRVIE